MENTIFKTLSSIDITGKTKDKNNMTYLPWSSAWDYVKNLYPNSTFEIKRTVDSGIYFTDGKTCWVETSVTIKDGDLQETQNEFLPVMDYRNKAIPLDQVESTAVNKSIKRCLVKNLALFGLGLSLWNGEELSDNAKEIKVAEETEKKKELKAKVNEIIEIAKQKIADGIPQDDVYAVIEKDAGKKNPNAIKDIEIAEKVLAAIKELNQ